jgi:hypothetical protein
MTLEEYYVEQLTDPSAKAWFDKLVQLLREIAGKEKLSRTESDLIHSLFTVLPRETGEFDRLEYLLSRLASR